MPSSTPNPKTNPAIELLLAYDEADLMAAVHYQALLHQQYPVCLCQSGARLEFKRRYRRLLAYSVATLPSLATAYGDDFADEPAAYIHTAPPAANPRHSLHFWRMALACGAAVLPVWWLLFKGFQFLHF